MTTTDTYTNNSLYNSPYIPSYIIPGGDSPETWEDKMACVPCVMAYKCLPNVVLEEISVPNYADSFQGTDPSCRTDRGPWWIWALMITDILT